MSFAVAPAISSAAWAGIPIMQTANVVATGPLAAAWGSALPAAAAGTAMSSTGAALLNAGISGAGSAAIGSMNKPDKIDLPRPGAAPSAPAKVSSTAAAERARIASKLRGGGLSKLVLSKGSETSGAPSRTTLLGT